MLAAQIGSTAWRICAENVIAFPPYAVNAPPGSRLIRTAALDFCKIHAEKYGNEIFIIGGGEIYHQSVQYVDTIFLTRIHQNYEGDATYPDPDPAHFQLVERLDRTEPEPFSIMTFKRK